MPFSVDRYAANLCALCQTIAKFILPIEFAAIHTTAITSTMLLFDIYSSDPKDGFVEGIREEAERLHKECNGEWTKTVLAKMLRADSAIRCVTRIEALDENAS